MELLDGTDLQKLVKERGRFAADEVVGLLAQVARALDKSHALGIVHRDLKPENLFLHRREDGGTIVKVLDFGISKVLSGGAMSAAPMTQMGAVMGTPLYMAPEQAGGAVHAVGPATDVWALGLIAVFLLTGEPYWARVPTPHGWLAPQSLTELIALLVQAQLYPPSHRWPFLPPLFDAWLARACARDPGARFPTAGHAVQELAMALGTAPPSIPLSAEAEGTVTDPYGATAATPSGQPITQPQAQPRPSYPYVPPGSAPMPPTAPVPYAPHGVPSPAYGMAPPTVPMQGIEVAGGSTQGAIAHTLGHEPPSGVPVGKILAVLFGLGGMAAGVGLLVWALLPSPKSAAGMPPEPSAIVLPAPTPTKIETDTPLPELHHPVKPLATMPPAMGGAAPPASSSVTAEAPPPTAKTAAPPATTAPAKPPPPATASTKPGGVDADACKSACTRKCASAKDRFACINACLFDECSNF
jgi:hypothetical protein